LQAKASKPKAKRKTAAKAAELTPEQELARIVADRKARRKAEEKDTAAIVAMATARALPVAQIAKRLGVKRQAVYQLAASRATVAA
jgi:hypothetical protein